MKLTKIQKDTLMGHLLGDGFLELHKDGKNACFRLLRKLEDKEYLLWSAKIFENLLSAKGISEGHVYDYRTKKTYHNIKFRTHVNSELTKLHEEWYKNKIKIIPKKLKLNMNIVKVWFADDGYVKAPKDNLNKTRFEIKIATHCFTEREVKFLKKELYRLCKVIFSIYKEMGKYRTQYFLQLYDKIGCRKFLRSINKEFPLKRKSDIWNNPEFKLWKDLPEFPKCKFCKSPQTFRNGHLRGIQTYGCKNCNRQFNVRNKNETR